VTGFLRRNPDVSDAAKSGSPTMDPPKRDIPATVPVTADAAPGFSGDVTVAPVTGSSALDTQPDARTTPPAEDSAKSGDAKTADPTAQTPAGKKKKK
jgi:hypothetical protein